MTLIELFTDYIRNQKSLVDYVEERKKMTKTRGEFNNETLLLAAEKLERLKEENPAIYKEMHELLEEYYDKDEGHFVEYPINFTKQILKLYENERATPERVVACYREGLDHPCQDAF
ncbi:MAG: hypothetical protein ACI9TV_002642 [Sulfurimonas sp.]|jgi:uncharacterized protein (UPF0335 family)|uniref:hypothetical protein n=1 Tax=Sulfurimonas sp. TaxID=2022749 RepID=UPI0039E2E64E